MNKTFQLIWCKKETEARIRTRAAYIYKNIARCRREDTYIREQLFKVQCTQRVMEYKSLINSAK